MLLIYIREAEFTLIESIKHWRPLYLQWNEKVTNKITLLSTLRYHIASLKIQKLFKDSYYNPIQFLSDLDSAAYNS